MCVACGTRLRSNMQHRRLGTATTQTRTVRSTAGRGAARNLPRAVLGSAIVEGRGAASKTKRSICRREDASSTESTTCSTPPARGRHQARCGFAVHETRHGGVAFARCSADACVGGSARAPWLRAAPLLIQSRTSRTAFEMYSLRSLCRLCWTGTLYLLCPKRCSTAGLQGRQGMPGQCCRIPRKVDPCQKLP